MNNFKSFYFFISLGIHLVIVATFVIFSHHGEAQKNFIVLGVHSQKPTKSFYKATRYSVPFVAALKKKIGSSVSRGSQRGSGKAGIRSQKQKNSIKKSVSKKVKALKESKLVAQAETESVVPERVTTVEPVKKEKKRRKKSKKKKKKVERKVKREVRQAPSVKTQEEQVQEKLEQKKRIKRMKKAKQEPLPQKSLPQAVAPGPSVSPVSPDELDYSSTATTIIDLGEPVAGNHDENLEFSLGDLSDMRLRGYYEYIQKEVSRLWRPPVGVAKGTECSLSFYINSEGKVENFEIIKRSDVLIYDLSVLRVAQNYEFDKCLWGKKFTINFRQ